MLSEQDTRAVEVMVRCNMKLDDLCDIFPAFEREDSSAQVHVLSWTRMVMFWTGSYRLYPVTLGSVYGMTTEFIWIVLDSLRFVAGVNNGFIETSNEVLFLLFLRLLYWVRVKMPLCHYTTRSEKMSEQTYSLKNTYSNN